MPNSRPIATDLLAVVQDYLETEIAPRVPPHHRFQLRIVKRALETVQRELLLGRDASQREAARLRELLRRDASLDEMNAALARGIREGDFPLDDPALLAHLRATIEDALAINNPKWAATAR
jgi:hypothetical protein